MRTSPKPNKLYIIRKVLMTAVQNVLFIEFEPLCQKLWAFMSNFGNFTMPALQIWPCHVTQEANFEKIVPFLILFHNFHLILGKVTKFLVEKLSTSEVISQKPHGGWKTPPHLSALRVRTGVQNVRYRS